MAPVSHPRSEARESARDSSDPPPPPSTRGDNLVGEAANAVLALTKARKAREEAAVAADDAAEALAGVRRIESVLGCEAAPAQGITASGLLGTVGSLVGGVAALNTKLDVVVAEIAKRDAGHGVWAGRALDWVVRPALTIAVAGLAAWLAGFHR